MVNRRHFLIFKWPFAFAILFATLVWSSYLVLAVSAGLYEGKREAINSTSEIDSWHAHIHESTNETVTFNVTLNSVTHKEGLYFVEKLFHKYGDTQGMDPADLRNLLRNLGLGILANASNSKSKRSFDLVHVHSMHEECLTVDEMLEAFHLAALKSLSHEHFFYLCPALVYQLDMDMCNHSPHTLGMGSGDSVTHQHHNHSEETKKNVKKFDLSEIPARVWGFSIVAVAFISLVGLLGVAVIPIMQKVFYNHLLQFLVALAVGALSGDALLHLLPHSIMIETGGTHVHNGDEETHNHVAGAWKGLIALGGILFFFVMERLLTIITVIKRNRNSKKQTKKKRCEKFCDIEANKSSVASKLSHRQNGEDECDRTVMLVHPNKALKSYADAAHEEFMHQCDDDAHSLHSAGEKFPEMELMEMAKNSEVNVLGHSHAGHGHAHTVPTSVASVAWMVILGDGIHNFSDGLAIGAAFANSITGGFSTSVAVFCHELPHEIGDFAVLLRAGMTVKQAVMYNCLSSLLCLIGMVIGVSIGNISSASLWIFAAVGGMFLYIALVDMLPEMSSVDPKKGENPFLHLLLQVLGILMGSSIMLVIALFEHDIKAAFE